MIATRTRTRTRARPLARGQEIIYCQDPAEWCDACPVQAKRDYCRPEEWERIYQERRERALDEIAAEARKRWGHTDEPEQPTAAEPGEPSGAGEQAA